MSTKLNDKSLGMITSSGIKDHDLGMMVPHQMDMCAVKKEMATLDEVDTIKKEMMTS